MTLEPQRLTDTLTEILDTLELPAKVEQRQQLVDLVGLLQRWNGVYNLTAIRDPGAMMVQHLSDCLATIRPLDAKLAINAGVSLLDVGSGAGFPGSVIAVMRPHVSVTCIDSVGKKAAFIRQSASSLGLSNLVALHGRVEALEAGPFDVITSRALSDLAHFVRLTRHLAATQSIWMAMKSQLPSSETGGLAALNIEFHVEPLVVPMLDAERCLVWMSLQK